jgi:hypothetical protein
MIFGGSLCSSAFSSSGAFVNRFVETNPGHSAVTPSPCRPNSFRNESLNPTIANFDVQYAVTFGMPTSPKTLHTLSTCASGRASSDGSNSRVNCTCDSKFTLSSLSQCSADIFSVLP